MKWKALFLTLALFVAVGCSSKQTQSDVADSSSGSDIGMSDSDSASSANLGSSSTGMGR